MDNQILLSFKDNEEELAAKISKDDIAFLVSSLSDKDDVLRYTAFKTLQKRSEINSDVYAYFNVFAEKLDSSNSYQRSLGAMLISQNIKWDNNNLFEGIYEKYLALFIDEKFITCRQAIQSIEKWIAYKPNLCAPTARALMSADINRFKDTQKPLILTDILCSLIVINNICPQNETASFIKANLDNEILKKPHINKIKERLNNKKEP